MNTESIIFWMLLAIAIVWLIVLFFVFKSIADRKDLTIIGKSVWLLIIFLAPVLGLIAYLAVGKKAIKRR